MHQAIILALAVGVTAAHAQPSPTDVIKSLGLSEAVRADEDRLNAITAEVLLQGKETPLFGGRRGIDATALLMLGIAFHETGLQERYERCDCRPGECDNGHAYGLPQLHAEHFSGPRRVTDEDYTTADFCAQRVVQWTTQVRALARDKAWCKSIDPQFEDRGPMIWLGAYNSGQCRASTAGTMAYANFTRMAQRAGIRVEKHGSRWVAY